MATKTTIKAVSSVENGKKVSVASTQALTTFNSHIERFLVSAILEPVAAALIKHKGVKVTVEELTDWLAMAPAPSSPVLVPVKTQHAKRAAPDAPQCEYMVSKKKSAGRQEQCSRKSTHGSKFCTIHTPKLEGKLPVVSETTETAETTETTEEQNEEQSEEKEVQVEEPVESSVEEQPAEEQPTEQPAEQPAEQPIEQQPAQPEVQPTVDNVPEEEQKPVVETPVVVPVTKPVQKTTKKPAAKLAPLGSVRTGVKPVVKVSQLPALAPLVSTN